MRLTKNLKMEEEVIIPNNKTNDAELKQIIIECVGNDAPYWVNPIYEVVNKIIALDEGEECTIGQLLPNINDYTSKQLFDFNKTIVEVCSKIRIKLDYSKHDGQVIGLPWNISFTKRIN